MEEWTEILSKIKESRKSDILECAKSVFMKGGFAHVTMKDIADLAGISRTTLYKYFNSIDEIAYTIQVMLVSEIDEYEMQEVDTYDDLEEQVLSILDKSYEYTIKHPENRRFTMMFDSYYRGNDCYKKNVSEESIASFDRTMEKLRCDRAQFFYKGFSALGMEDKKKADLFSEIFCGLVIAHNQRIASGGYHMEENLYEEFKKVILNYFRITVRQTLPVGGSDGNNI